METVKGICSGDRLNVGGGCETVMTSRVMIGWMKFRECGKLLSREKVFFENERDGLSKLCKISYVIWK